MISHDSTINPPIHPPNQTPTHGWGSLHRIQIFKWNQIILIRSIFIACACDTIGNSQGYPNGSSHLHEIIMFIMHTCVSELMHACMHGVALTHPHPHPPTHPPPKGGNTQNTEISICLELIEIIQFCLKNFYLWTLLNSSRLTLITLDTPTHLPHPLEPKKLKS